MNTELFNHILRRWGKNDRPIRKLILWALDEENNPSFLILFGFHEFENFQVSISESEIEEFNKEMISTGLCIHENEISPGRYNVLKTDVGYFGYVIFKGIGGHFPNLQDLSLSPRSSNDPNVIELKFTYSHNKFKARYFGTLNHINRIKIPYFQKPPYEKIIEKVKERKSELKNFTLVDNPNDILGLEKDLIRFLDLFIKIFSHERIYLRKKFLKELILLDPPKDVYKKIIKLGSPEVLSGLFLELTAKKNPVLKEGAEELNSKQIFWAEKNFGEGIKRCATIYLNAIDPDLREKRINEIRKDVEDLQLEIIDLRIPSKDKILRQKGRKYFLEEDIIHYACEWESIGNSLKFKSNIFTDGSSLNHIFFKNILQEAHIHCLPDIMGKIAHFVDSPKFLYLMINSKNYGTGIFFIRSIKRFFSQYALENELYYLMVIKSFLSAYKNSDVVTGYSKELEFNPLLNYIIEPPRYRYRSRGRKHASIYVTTSINSKNFKYKREKEEHEKRNKILLKNPIILLEILSDVKGSKILDFLFGFINQISDFEEVVKKISIKLLVKISESPKFEVSQYFKKILEDKLIKLIDFDTEVMLALLESSDVELHSLAWEYYRRVKGFFTPQDIVKMLWMENISYWIDFFEENFSLLDENQYYEFLRSILVEKPEKLTRAIQIREELIEILLSSTNKINELSYERKKEIINISLDVLRDQPYIAKWISQFLKNLICSVSLEGLTKILRELKLDFKEEFGNKRVEDIITIFRAIQNNNLPEDAKLLEIINTGPPRMVNLLIKHLKNRKELLVKRQATLLVLFESNLMVLNSLVEEVFELIPLKLKETTFSFLIDSPNQNAQSFALNKLDEQFQGKIPKEIIIKLLEHGSLQVKSYLTNKINQVINELSRSNGKAELFMYYFKTLILLPNLQSKNKDKLYESVPEFVKKNNMYKEEIQEFLLEMGASNIIKDSERALVALAKIKQEG